MDITAIGYRRARDWKGILLSSGFIVAIVTFTIFGYNTWYNIPVLTYEILPAYPISQQDQVAAVIVRNEGRVSATEVRIVIEGSGQISVLPTRIQEEFRVTIENSKAIVTLPRLPQGAQISFFLKVQTQASSPITDVYVSSLQGMGSKRSTTSQDPVTMAKDILALLGVLLVLAGISSAVSALRKKQAKKKVPAQGN